jgi:type III secretion protein J
MYQTPRWRLFLGLLLAFLLTACNDVLFAKLSESQANEVLAALSEAGIPAIKEPVDDTTWRIEVPSDKVGTALLFLRARALPSQPRATMGEVFKKDGLISSPTEERARYNFALQEDIASTLRRIDGVVDARVHVAIPHNDPLSDRVVPVSASVFLKYRRPLDIDLVAPQIKALVTASVEGLDYRNIALFPFTAETLPNGPMSAHFQAPGQNQAEAGGPPGLVQWLLGLIGAALLLAVVMVWRFGQRGAQRPGGAAPMTRLPDSWETAGAGDQFDVNTLSAPSVPPATAWRQMADKLKSKLGLQTKTSPSSLLPNSETGR